MIKYFDDDMDRGFVCTNSLPLSPAFDHHSLALLLPLLPLANEIWTIALTGDFISLQISGSH